MELDFYVVNLKCECGSDNDLELVKQVLDRWGGEFIHMMGFRCVKCHKSQVKKYTIEVEL